MASHAETLRKTVALGQSPAGDLVRQMLADAIKRSFRRAIYGVAPDERTLGAGGVQALEEVLDELNTAQQKLTSMENRT